MTIDSTSTTPADTAPFFPAPRTCPFSVPDGYTEFREKGGLQKVTIWDGSTQWLATGYDETRAVLASPSFSADVRNENFPLSFANQRVEQAGLLLRLDDPQHAKQRRMLTKEFSVKNVEALKPRLAEITDELIDAMLEKGSPVDFVESFALPLPSQAICMILGVPYEDREIFQRHADSSTDLDTTHDVRVAMQMEAFQYYMSLVESKKRNPGDDLISRLLTNHMGPDGFQLEELPALVFLLVAGGHDTTAKMLGLSVMALLNNPEQRDRLRADPSLAPSAAEELLRYWGVVSTDPRRVATEDVEIGGQLVRAGEGIVVSLVAANRDPKSFGPDADELDLSRGARNHFAFGFGTHQCLGQNLARAELQVALPRIFERIPDLRLAVPHDQLDFTQNSIVFGARKLPVAWGAAQ